jgi:hypothetical protein
LGIVTKQMKMPILNINKSFFLSILSPVVYKSAEYIFLVNFIIIFLAVTLYFTINKIVINLIN